MRFRLSVRDLKFRVEASDISESLSYVAVVVYLFCLELKVSARKLGVVLL